MKKHDYTPAPVSRRRGPKSRKPAIRQIGVWFVGADPESPSLNWFQERIAELQEHNVRKRVELQMLFSKSANELPQAITRGHVDGVIILGQDVNPKLMTELSQLPCVWFMSSRSATYSGDFVEPNNEENGAMAAEYLATQGHRHVAVLTSDDRHHAVAWRIRAFMQRAQTRGLTAHRILGASDPGMGFPEIPPLVGECDELVRRLVELTPCPSGLYIPVDHCAKALIRALHSVGYPTTRKFEIILGNYDPLFVNKLYPRPTALDINLSTLINKAIDHLVWRIENPDRTGRIGIKIAPTLRPARG
jgi:DNA-binding LacI/PurR family transcriptional regulator